MPSTDEPRFDKAAWKKLSSVMISTSMGPPSPAAQLPGEEAATRQPTKQATAHCRQSDAYEHDHRHCKKSSAGITPAPFDCHGSLESPRRPGRSAESLRPPLSVKIYSTPPWFAMIFAALGALSGKRERRSALREGRRLAALLGRQPPRRAKTEDKVERDFLRSQVRGRACAGPEGWLLC